MSSPISHLSEALIKYQTTFQKPKELCALAQTSKHFLKLLGPKCTASQLLFCVLNIDERNKKRIMMVLAKLKIKESILIRATGIEWHNDNPIQVKRTWKDVSPLEAAAKCGDVHLVRMLMEKLSFKERTLAITQLEGVKAARTIPSEPGSYICGLAELNQSYKTYLELFRIHNLEQDNFNSKILKELNETLGDVQKKLPCFLLQAFFSFIRKTGSDVTKEPERRVHIVSGYHQYQELNTKAIGKGTESALASIYQGEGEWMMGYSAYVGSSAAERDSNLIAELYTVLPAELDKIIESAKNKNHNGSGCSIM